MRRTLFFAAVLFLVVNNNSVASPVPKKNMHLYVSHFENVLGTSMEFKASALSQQAAANAENAAIQEIKRLSKILSAYDAESEFSHWMHTSNKSVPVSKELFDVLQLFDEWRVKTGGALDASAEVIGKVWRNAAAQQTLPSQEQLNTAVTEVQKIHWALDPATQSAVHISNAPLMLNSFVKSYIIKSAAELAGKSNKIEAVLVNIGGDMVVSGNHNETIRVSDPKADAENETPIDEILINNKAVATSGNYRRGEMINGHWYSHIVDPRTGIPADNILSATVVADNATDAGALATAFNVMTPAESKVLASKVPGAEYMIITKDGERIESAGWKAMELPVTEKNLVADNKSVGANDFEMVVNLEVAQQKEGFAKRPYVAIWVEDENHAAIRTLTVWHATDRYMPELRSWYLKYRSLYTSDKNFSTSITSATRSAGKYTVKWDGKDDKGEVMKPGKYTIKIEASREHGTYQLMRQEFDWNETPKQITLTGNVEIASASLDFKKK